MSRTMDALRAVQEETRMRGTVPDVRHEHSVEPLVTSEALRELFSAGTVRKRSRDEIVAGCPPRRLELFGKEFLMRREKQRMMPLRISEASEGHGATATTRHGKRKPVLFHEFDIEEIESLIFIGREKG